MPRSAVILFFATARVATGTPRMLWPVEENGISARALLRALATTYPDLAPTLATSRFVLNGHYLSNLGTRVRAGDEFAVHPPYGGG